ncbi:MAG TPA: hypothetical protein PLA02_09990 [Brevefilum fermentans]|nr:hypothetical protein [Chloroflexota bacterium]HQA29528.1 hypothetical protein [Brevefilum fermentans]
MRIKNHTVWDFRLDLLAAAYGRFVCNYACPYCHRDYFVQSIPAQIKPVPLVEGVQLCNQVLPGKFSLHLAGSGEPLLIPYDKLAPIVNPLTELENCTSISLTTNGYFLQDKVDELIS